MEQKNEELEQLRSNLLEQITKAKINAFEAYQGFLDMIIAAMVIKDYHVNKIYDISTPISGVDTENKESITLLEIIGNNNKTIYDEKEKMKLTKEEINSFFHSVENKINMAMDANDLIQMQVIVKIINPLITMVLVSNSCKNMMFEVLGYLKEQGKLNS